MITIVDYDAAWPGVFERLRAPVWTAVAGHALAVEHVGSTAVPGLAAKPIIDLDVIIASPSELPAVIAALAGLGYAHRGTRGIEGREAFRSPAGLPAHHLYVCLRDSVALANHRAIRERLRRDPGAVSRYGRLKRRLAAESPGDIDRYVTGKTDFLLELLAEEGLPEAALRQIREANARS